MAGGRRGRETVRRSRIVGLLALAAVMAAAVAAAVGVPLRSIGTADRSLVALEPGGSKAHHSTHRDLVADRRRRAACRNAAYLRRHRATCPGRPARGQRAMDTVLASGTGAWGAPFEVASWPIHEILLPTGKVLWLMYADDHANGGRAFVWDPATHTSREVDPPAVRYADGVTRPANLFCSGHAQLADGRVLVAGGNLAFPDSSGGPDSDFKGAPWIFTFDPWTETWTRQPDMSHGRWYPTVTTLPDGTALIMGGTDETGGNVNNPAIELFTPSPTISGQGTVRVVANRAVSLYPHAFVVPDTTGAGRAPGTQVLIAGPATDNTAILNTADWSWTDVPDLPTPRLWGNAVLLPSASGAPSRVMMVGGSNLDVTPSAQRTTVVLDLNDVGAGWQPGPSLTTGRSHSNTVILPDDSLLAVGGGGGISGNGGSLYVDPVYAAERWSPVTNSWSAAGSQAEERTYHSTALLLPDGSVLSAGDDRSSHWDPGTRRGEIWSPPYMGGPRPSVTDAPAAVRYGVPFTIRTSAPIDHVVLMHPSAVTHGDDMAQRSIRLAMTDAGGGQYQLTSPADGSVAPPGYYMLFAVDGQGRPSVARWIRIGTDAADAPLPTPVAAGAGGSLAGTGRTSGGTRAKALPVRVLGLKARGRRLTVTLAVIVPGRASASLSLVPPSRAGAKRGPAMVRRVPAGKARAAAVVVVLRAPRGWSVLSLPLIVRVQGTTTVRTRGRLVVRNAAPKPKAWTAP